ncbi:disease resistance protein RGA2-like isoform X2 [Nymphaea colorata]|uniref:disease resistance protein RGA2-like isoform X2 n=1 Tax=Nymphaea colorata TaxID=210225 RepID=UPI00129D4419|nr:disease resistance protein RGA2-like isoform X2 [Nymphaea colorata]
MHHQFISPSLSLCTKMAEIVAALLPIVAELVVGEAQRLASGVASVKSELRNLESQLKAIQPILEDAHNKQFTSRSIKAWIARVSHTIYDAEDIIDLYTAKTRDLDAQTRQGKVRKQLSSLSFMCRNILFMRKTASEIKEVTERLNSLYKEKDNYGLVPLTTGLAPPLDQTKLLCSNRLTTSNITEQNIFGREKDEELVVEWLKKRPDNKAKEANHVVAIVGMGGLGKTTLAKWVYKNSSIRAHFEKFIWICASERPRLQQLFEQILEQLKNKREKNITGLEALNLEIMKHLKGKKFLLVIDDAWDYDWWTELNGLLQQGALGSRVLITTRKEEVKVKIDDVYVHPMKCLSDDESWCLFVNKVLRRDETEEELDRVKDVGRHVVKNCKGLPLALSVVGSLLKQKERKISDWEKVKNSPFWKWDGIVDNDENKEILSTIALSYMNLPFSLKRCLTYCSMYPKDYPMYKEDLAWLWVAEGFITEKEALPEETEICTAHTYLDMLVGCSLVQFNRDLKLYKLHDIVHDFASSMRLNENANPSNLSLTARTSPSQARSLCITNSHESLVDGTQINQHTKLRTLVLRGDLCRTYPLASILLNLKWLRVLDLSDNFHLQVLPETLGDLVLLKYLNLRFTGITTLPESISRLRSLEMLNLSGTRIEMLPKGTSKLRALRHLPLGDEYSFPICMPENIGKLTVLQTLNNFVVGSDTSKSNGCSIKELNHMNNLEGLLCIHHIERVHNRVEAKDAGLHKKAKLHELRLHCGPTSLHQSNSSFTERIEGIFEELHPPKGLKTLEVSYYAGTWFPSWISSLSCLQRVSIKNCNFLKELPMLTCLPKLETLVISNMKSLEVWPQAEPMPQLNSLEVYDCPKLRVLPAGFPKLESLQIHRMGSLEEWTQIETMPFLRSVEIVYCPKLRSLLGGLRLTQLHELKLKDLPELDSMSLTSLDIIRELELHQLPKFDVQEHGFLHMLKTVTALKGLDLNGFPGLAMESQMAEEALENMMHLERLFLTDCPNLAAPVADLLQHHHLPRLQHVQICSRNSSDRIIYPSLVSLQLEIESKDGLSGFRNLGSRVDRLIIRLNDEVDSVPKWIQRLQNLYALEIHESPKLTHLPEWLGEFSQLQRLELVRLPELRSLPDGMRSLTQLQSLSIARVSGLTHLPEWLGELSQLRSLKLEDLPLLRSLPDKMQPLLYLRSLRINKCIGLRHLPEWLGRLTNLADLELRFLPGLRSLPEGLGRLCSLRLVRLEVMAELTSLPNGMRDLPQLQLQIEDCTELLQRNSDVIERRIAAWQGHPNCGKRNKKPKVNH